MMDMREKSQTTAEADATNLLSEIDRSLEEIGRHGDRIDELLKEIKAVRSEPVVSGEGANAIDQRSWLPLGARG